MIVAKHPSPTPSPIDMQARRIRWQTGMSETAARLIAGLAYGEGR